MESIIIIDTIHSFTEIKVNLILLVSFIDTHNFYVIQTNEIVRYKKNCIIIIKLKNKNLLPTKLPLNSTINMS